jgi:hypothetical protein
VSALGRRAADGAAAARAARREGCGATAQISQGAVMLWLIIGVVLLIIAIAGGSIVHPVLFAIGILALLVFLVGRRGTTV